MARKIWRMIDRGEVTGRGYHIKSLEGCTVLIGVSFRFQQCNGEVG